MQDNLSKKRLELMSKIVSVPNLDWTEIEEIMKKYFTTRPDKYGYTKQMRSKKITKSPIFIELYLRDQFKEIDFESLTKELEKIRLDQNQQSKESETGGILFTEQEIGKATINVPTLKKQEANKQVQNYTRESSIYQE